MSVEEAKTIDFVSLKSKPGTVLLVVSDHLEWTATDDHEFALQEKLNAYLSFVENGELHARFPQAKGKRIEILVILQHAPDQRGRKFLQNVVSFIKDAGFDLTYQIGIVPLPSELLN